MDTTASTEPNSMKSPSSARTSHLGVWSFTCALIVVFSLLRTLPFTGRVVPVPEDDSWHLMLSLLASRHALCGKDYIFTFGGPLCFMYGQTYMPLLFNMKVALQALLCSLTTIVMVMQGKRLFASPFRTSIWILGLLTFYGLFYEVFFLAMPILLINQYFLIDDREKQPSIESLILVFLMALGAMVKFTFFVAGTWTITFVLLDEVFVRRKRPILATTFLVVLILAWLCTGQPIDTLASYFLASLPIASGHSEAMAIHDTNNWLLTLLASMFCAALLFLAFAKLAYKKLGKGMWPALLAESGLFF